MVADNGEGEEVQSSQGQDTSDQKTQQEMEVDQQSDEKHFVLAPTPAQLGKAPLQRRLASSCSQDSTKDLSPTETPTTSSSFSGMFSASTATTTTTSTMDEPPPTSANSKKKQFLKKAKNDDMDT